MQQLFPHINESERTDSANNCTAQPLIQQQQYTGCPCQRQGLLACTDGMQSQGTATIVSHAVTTKTYNRCAAASQYTMLPPAAATITHSCATD